MAAQIEHLTRILLSLSPGTGLRQRSHTLPLTPLLLSPPPHLHSVCETCCWAGFSQDHLSLYQQTGSPHGKWSTQLWEPAAAHANEAALRRLEKGWGEGRWRELKSVWENQNGIRMWRKRITLKYITFSRYTTHAVYHLMHSATLPGVFFNWLYSWISLSNSKTSTTDIVPLFSLCQLPCARQRSLCCSLLYITECVLGLFGLRNKTRSLWRNEAEVELNSGTGQSQSNSSVFMIRAIMRLWWHHNK